MSDAALFARRLRLLAAARRSPLLQRLLLAQCQRDILFWFDHFCWTFDPRLPQPHRPFAPYAFQRELIGDLQAGIEAGNDLLIEKSRDMGVSWLVLLVFQYYWLFRHGANFHLGSRKQEMVDRKGDISTLMEKLRYNLRWMPGWMRPPGFETSRHDNLLRLINPANGNSITGESSNDNFARGGRYRAVLFDEFPFWPMQDAAYASAGQSTPSRLLVGTPYGKNNRFAELRFSGEIKVLSLHWSRHPMKDATWYAGQQRRLSEDELARELDINYHLSLKDRVFRNFTETNKGDLGALKDYRVIRSWDFGYHCPACLFIQIDGDGCLHVLREVVGHADLLIDFARRVQAVSDEFFTWSDHATVFEDVCDPAGAQRSDKSAQTSIEILNSLGIYPHYDRTRILDGLELIRMKLSERIPADASASAPEPSKAGERPGLLVDRRCHHLIEAFEGGYRYGEHGGELPLQEHPYEDVMDCLRYAVMHKCSVSPRARPKKARTHHRPQNRYTGY